MMKTIIVVSNSRHDSRSIPSKIWKKTGCDIERMVTVVVTIDSYIDPITVVPKRKAIFIRKYFFLWQ